MSVDENIIQDLAELTAQFFEKTLSLSVSSKEKREELSCPPEIVGTIKLTGELTGSLSIQLSADNGCRVASKVISKEISDFADGGEDGIRSMLRIVADGLKARSAGKVNFQIGDFECTADKGFDLGRYEKENTSVIHYEIDGGAFDLILAEGEPKAESSSGSQPSETEEGTSQEQPQAAEPQQETAQEPPSDAGQEQAEPSQAKGEKAILEELDKSAQETQEVQEPQESQETGATSGAEQESPQEEDPAGEDTPSESSEPQEEDQPAAAGAEADDSDELISDAMKKLDDLLSRMKEDNPA